MFYRIVDMLYKLHIYLYFFNQIQIGKEKTAYLNIIIQSK